MAVRAARCALPSLDTSGSPALAPLRSRLSGWAPFLLLGAPLGVVALRLAARLGGGFVAAGDLAVLELGVRNALRGRQLLGAYSRFGWDQLGPAWFYLAGPLYKLGGSDTRALFLATWVLNAAAAVAVVAVVRRRAGAAPAACAAAAVLAWLLAVSPRVAMSPWNPLALALPLLLTLVLAAAAVTGSGWSLVGAAAVGSLVVQCHLGSVPVVAAALIVGTVGWFRRRSDRPRPASRTRRPRLAAVGAAVGLLVLWLPTGVEQVTHSPGNLVTLTRFFRDTPPDLARHHPLDEAASTVARQTSAIPLGRDTAGQLDTTTHTRQLVGLGWMGLAGMCATLAWRRRQRFAAACGLVAAIGGVAAVVAASRVTGALLAYLVFYATVLPVPVLIGLGILALGDGRARFLARAGGIGCSVLLVAATWAAARTPLEPEPPSPEVAVAARLADDALTESGAHRVVVRQQRHEYWPVTVGLTLALERAGYDVAVDRHLVSLVGEDWGPDGRQDAELIVVGPPDTRPAGRQLGQTGALTLWMRELS